MSRKEDAGKVGPDWTSCSCCRIMEAFGLPLHSFLWQTVGVMLLCDLGAGSRRGFCVVMDQSCLELSKCKSEAQGQRVSVSHFHQIVFFGKGFASKTLCGSTS